jgi:SAM-dependent methyltransferase
VVAPHLVVAGVLFAIAGFFVYFFLSGLIWGSGYAPTSKRQLEAAGALLELREGDIVVDLGSGFGRALIFFATRYHVSAIGVEIDPLRRLITNWSLRRRRLASRVSVRGGNLLDLDLRGAAKVFFFLTPLLMRKLQEKLAREMPHGGLVVSVEHRFPDWIPVRSVEGVHLYVVGGVSGDVSGSRQGALHPVTGA